MTSTVSLPLFKILQRVRRMHLTHFFLIVAPVRKTTHKSRRSDSSVLLDSIKKAYHHIRRSLSSDRRAATPKSPSSFSSTKKRTTSRPRCRSQRRSRGANKPTTVEPSCLLLRRFPDESCLVQLKRNPSTGLFDVGFSSDGPNDEEVHVSSLGVSGRQCCSFKGRKFLRVGDRVLEVQNTRVKDMRETTKTDAVQQLLGGCEVATIRVIGMKHTKP